MARWATSHHEFIRQQLFKKGPWEVTMNRIVSVCIMVLMLIVMLATNDSLQSRSSGQAVTPSREESIQRLERSLAGRGNLKRNRATRLVDFIRLDPRARGSLIQIGVGTTRAEKSLAFLTEHRQEFGLLNPNQDLRLKNEQRDLQGGAHLTLTQTYNGVPVFAGVVKAHFNSAGELRAVNGVIVPDIQLSTTPTRTSEEAAAFALVKVQNDQPNASGLASTGAKLYIFRTGLAQGVEGENHLVWEITVSNKAEVTEFVYVDAHSGKFVDQLTGTYEALNRRIYDGQNMPQFPPPSYPSNPYWVEGQQFPTGNANADRVIASTKETYDLFRNGFGRDSFDDLGSPMVAIFDSGFGTYAESMLNLTSFGPEQTVDDVIAHEWTHLYTNYTGHLIYQWQPGAVNEAYSDIFGETVDLLNGRGLDTGGQRQPDDCFHPLPTLHVHSPAFLQADYRMSPSIFGPAFSSTGVTGNVVLINDGSGVRTDGCQTPFRNAAEINGNIALIDWGLEDPCTVEEKLRNAQSNGATAVILAPSGPYFFLMFGSDPTITIPSGVVDYSTGQTLRSPRAKSVSGTITGGDATNSVRWLFAEESGYQGLRDMWNPRCYQNPGKVSDTDYFCGTFDSGGVHLNSSVPNHAYALLVDGGTYNGQTIAPIGLTKAAHIYFRAMAFYQTPTSDFADHAEALEASASDLVGINLSDLTTGVPSGQSISLFDLDQVYKATLAVELRTPPTQCGFQPLLAKNPPEDTCPALQNTQIEIFSDNFESDPTSNWSVSRDVSNSDTFTSRDWLWVQQLPDGRAGSGFLAPDPIYGCNSAIPGEAGVLHLDSPEITLPPVMIGGPHLSFDHYVATEAGFDGGQLMISVNGGPFQLIDSSVFMYNGYNTTLFPVPAGFEDQAPRAGQEAFSGGDGGILKGSWGTSIIDLTRYAHSGDRIRLRWDFSTDYCFGTNLGWYLDNIRVYACGP
jgi:Zn-dependent metalloprotease